VVEVGCPGDPAQPRYTGRRVWNRRRREEVLIDVDDVALGHETKQRWNPEGEWIWSADTVHEPLISPELFEAAQLHARAGTQRAVDRKPRATGRPYALRRLISCGLCGRRMQGPWIAGRARYRCSYPNEYGLANQILHPRNIYVREDAILPQLDAWLAGLFDRPTSTPPPPHSPPQTRRHHTGTDRTRHSWPV
jgi:hypothetical protein